MTFLTFITFNQWQSKPLVCMANPLPHLELSWKETRWHFGRPRERQWLHQRLSLAVERGNTLSILTFAQVWSDFSHPQCINQCSLFLLVSCLFSMNGHRLPNVRVFCERYCLRYFFHAFCEAHVQYCFVPLFSCPDLVTTAWPSVVTFSLRLKHLRPFAAKLVRDAGQNATFKQLNDDRWQWQRKQVSFQHHLSYVPILVFTNRYNDSLHAFLWNFPCTVLNTHGINCFVPPYHHGLDLQAPVDVNTTVVCTRVARFFS